MLPEFVAEAITLLIIAGIAAALITHKHIVMKLAGVLFAFGAVIYLMQTAILLWVALVAIATFGFGKLLLSIRKNRKKALRKQRLAELRERHIARHSERDCDDDCDLPRCGCDCHV